MDGKKIVTQAEENELVETIIGYACRHNFTATNIMDAAQKAMIYMSDNAVLKSEDYIYKEIESSDQAD